MVHFTSREAELEKSRLAVTDAEKAQQQVSIELTRSMEDIRQKEGQFIATRERLEARTQFIQRATAEQNASKNS